MRTCLHSVGYSGTWGGQTALTLEQFIEKAAKLGYESVEFAGKRPHASPLDMDEKRRRQVRDLLAEKSLTLACIASYHDFSTFYKQKDMAFMEKELVYMKSILQLSYDLGCNLVRTYTGYYKEEIPYGQQWDSCVKGVQESAKMAQDYGITIGVQNHSDIASNPDSLLDFLSEVNEPNVKAVLDAPYIHNHNKPLRETVLKYKGLMVHTHLADHVIRGKYIHLTGLASFDKNGFESAAVPVGQGEIDYVEFFNALKEIGYTGALSYEMCSRVYGGGSEENLDNNAAETLRSVKSLINM
jgi:sugar phosphate isomerase/epimerase